MVASATAAFAARGTGAAIVAAGAAVTVAMTAAEAAATATVASMSTAITAATATVASVTTAVAATISSIATRLARSALTRGREFLFGRRREKRLAGEADLAGIRLDPHNLHL